MEAPAVKEPSPPGKREPARVSCANPLRKRRAKTSMVTTSMSNSEASPNDPKDKKGPDAQPARARSIPVPRSRRGPKTFYNEVVREMKKVSWPSRTETNRLTGVVLTVCLLLVAYLSALGYVFGAVIDIITKGRVG